MNRAGDNLLIDLTGSRGEGTANTGIGLPLISRRTVEAVVVVRADTNLPRAVGQALLGAEVFR